MLAISNRRTPSLSFLKQAPLLISLAAASQANAGWLSPDTYDECVLERMKGQAKAMIYHARNACELEFPYEKKLQYMDDLIDYAWGVDSESVGLNIKSNHSKYKITRASAVLSIKPCSDHDDAGSKFRVSFYIIDRKGLVKHNASAPPKCMRSINFYGVRSAP